jgi:hypothetical protein
VPVRTAPSTCSTQECKDVEKLADSVLEIYNSVFQSLKNEFLLFHIKKETTNSYSVMDNDYLFCKVTIDNGIITFRYEIQAESKQVIMSKVYVLMIVAYVLRMSSEPYKIDYEFVTNNLALDRTKKWKLLDIAKACKAYIDAPESWEWK